MPEEPRKPQQMQADSGRPPERREQEGRQRRDQQPASPVQSREDTDAAWGERPDPDDDERFYRDRPPHWASA